MELYHHHGHTGCIVHYRLEIFIVFAATSACVPLIVLPFLPETINRNLELIDKVFKEAPTVWDIVAMARRLPQGDARPNAGGMGE